ncbi:uncharacterized protein LOC117902762 [Drosophila subobscura]|uniref:uncharacterized protein LOC117902762 n=1 Tax=Drosophila subobscura TaxID=7241 RepID=UPI00155A182B|nr:uncharacterized protein LOC117902762 [Drosophila subobscura]
MNVVWHMNVVPLFIWTILMGNVRAKIDAYFTKMDCVNHMPGLMQNVSCRLDRKSHVTSSFSVEFTLANTVKDVNGTYIFGVKRGSTVFNYTTLDINYCEALEALYSNYLLKMIADELRRVTNFPLHCPFKKNIQFYIKDYTIDTKMIPSYVPEINFVSDCTLIISQKKAFQLILYGRVARRKAGR